ncbi:TetR family transcriptional regulator [Microtetraspora sp. NBRC 16547]|uniref:TetR/AcrR family transcriptional regulator n=1 Tax=Microtetraspora sp. NBRC 16547 TaxID=3030993 RepID=UPI0024A11821|nr:TetR family transcriptional regulator [Microtetraspora sp. NBRC 16547]GLW98111.1 TetR family transcriptional regulator [Microtetraspora sp. NBRC 16547]
MSAKPFSSVWTREPKGRREQGLSRDQIVRAALELLDEEGLDALSMRKLGARIGAGATSLYWHVANKDELLELAMDEVYREVPKPVGASWRETAGAIAWGLRGAILAHPWCVRLIGVLPGIGPNALVMSDLLVKACKKAGFQGIDIDFAVGAVVAYALGSAVPEAAWRGMLNRSGDSPCEAQTEMMPTIEGLAAGHPDLLERYKDYIASGVDPLTGRQIAFDYGLVALLDGLDARRGGQAGGQSGSRGTKDGGAPRVSEMRP